MILGTFKLHETSLETSNDDYMLETVSTVSTRRPFLSAGLMIGGLLSLFTFSFADILTFAEITGLTVASGFCLVVGLSIGRLHLVSRDLRGSPVADAVYGTYAHLNRERPKVVAAIARAKAKAGGAS